MAPMLRRLRGASLTALVWASAWGLAGALSGLVKWYWGDLIDVLPTPLSMALTSIGWLAREWAILGAINGFLFAALLALAERRQSVATLSLARVALWGGLATIVLPIVTLLVFVSVFGTSDFSFSVLPLVRIGALGAASATVILLIARRAKSSTIDSAA